MSYSAAGYVQCTLIHRVLSLGIILSSTVRYLYPDHRKCETRENARQYGNLASSTMQMQDLHRFHISTVEIIEVA